MLDLDRELKLGGALLNGVLELTQPDVAPWTRLSLWARTHKSRTSQSVSVCSVRRAGAEGAQEAAPAGSPKGGKGALTMSEMTTSWATFECMVRVCALWLVLEATSSSLPGAACV